VNQGLLNRFEEAAGIGGSGVLANAPEIAVVGMHWHLKTVWQNRQHSNPEAGDQLP
jgi:hypothetical protein